MKPKTYPAIFLILAQLLVACGFVSQTQSTPAGTAYIESPVTQLGSPSANTPTATELSTAVMSATSTPSQIPAQPQETVAPEARGKPPQSQRAEIRPSEMRDHLTRLSNLLNFQVVDEAGAELGTASNYIINTCETYIIYFALSPKDVPNISAGSQVIIPFESITINSGVLDAQNRLIQLYLTPDQISNAPTGSEGQNLLPTDWEAGVRDYWSQVFRLSNLTTECRVAASGGGTVSLHKIAYATDLLGAELQDGLQNVLGMVREAILEPESGKLGFYIVSLRDGQGLVLVPLSAVNIPREALVPGSKINLVLLTKNDVLINAPRIDTIEAATSAEVQNTARQYWSR
jgi:sporulation protein YlmC with PRC-barrel domain